MCVCVSVNVWLCSFVSCCLCERKMQRILCQTPYLRALSLSFSALPSSLTFPSHLLHPLPSTSLCRWLLFGASPCNSTDISYSLMLSFPHLEPTWRPITMLDNASHKSSIGLSDTWGLSTRANMLFSLFFSSLSTPLLLPSFPLLVLFLNRSREESCCIADVILPQFDVHF